MRMVCHILRLPTMTVVSKNKAGLPPRKPGCAILDKGNTAE